MEKNVMIVDINQWKELILSELFYDGFNPKDDEIQYELKLIQDSWERYNSDKIYQSGVNNLLNKGKREDVVTFITSNNLAS